MNVFARFAALAAFSLSSLAAGCNSQSEGQRCDLPSDCQSGLECRSVNPGYMACCPVNAASSVASCNPGSRSTEAGAADAASDAPGNVADTQSQDATPDAPAETSTPEEAAADAAAE
jgi:hypothetical protein